MKISNSISSHIGAFAMAATSIDNLSQDGILASYDVTAGRSFSMEAPALKNAPGMHA